MTHLDPYEIRTVTRNLDLINGKRKNMSSLLYTQTSPGRGETADISAIPTDAIERERFFVMEHPLNTDLMPLQVMNIFKRI
jgi:hypothetical protein